MKGSMVSRSWLGSLNMASISGESIACSHMSMPVVGKKPGRNAVRRGAVRGLRGARASRQLVHMLARAGLGRVELEGYQVRRERGVNVA